MKELIIFDLDGTLNASKAPLEKQMAALLCELLAKTKVAVISGASFAQFTKQFLDNLSCEGGELSRLFIMPTSGSSLYAYKQNKWTKVYEEVLSGKDAEKIRKALESAIISANIELTENVFGEIIENRGSQITYSALGQEAPIDMKKKWDPDHSKRDRIMSALLPLIPEFEAHIGGTTSIDITKKGVDKAYGVEKIKQYLNIQKENILFIGDAVFPGGNDYSVKEAGVETIKVSGPEETKKIIHEFLRD